jgi:hypothetical protein
MSSELIQEIEAAYRYDQEHNARPVTSREELPIAFEWITAEWLTDVLCRDVPGARVVDFDLGGVDDGSSNRRKIALRYNEAGQAAPRLPASVFCKAAHNLANRVVLGIGASAEGESNFYAQVRPRLDIEAPAAYYVKLDTKSWNSMIMLGDLSDSVTEFCNHHTVMTRARAESQMRLLARMHGKCYRDPYLSETTKKHFITWPDFFDRVLIFGMQEGSEEGFQKSREVLPPSLFARADEIWPGTLKSIAFHASAPQTFAHHDVHLKNWYVAGNGEMGLSDWQCAVRAHWSRDVAYTIATALPIEDRRAWEEDLLRYYLDHLHREGGPKLDFDEAFLHYRQQLVTALTWWTITINPAEGMPDMQPMDITLEFLRRIGTAMDDLGTMDALKKL